MKPATPKARALLASAPSVALQNMKDCCPAHIKPPRQNGNADNPWNVLSANLRHQLSCENSPSVSFSEWFQFGIKPVCGVIAPSLSAFRFSIISILLGCSGKEMIRIAARRIVAAMKKQLTILNNAARENKSNPVRPVRLFKNGNTTVSISVFIAKPQPTIIITLAIHFAPKFNLILGANVDYRKSVRYLYRSILHVQSMSNVKAVSLLNTARRLVIYSPSNCFRQPPQQIAA